MSPRGDESGSAGRPSRRPERAQHAKAETSNRYDCTRCGACCCNSDENRAEGYTAYVEVGPRDELRAHPELLERWTTPDAQGVPHLKLDRDGRCVALRGRLGQRVRCEIYKLRPHGCRRVVEGSEACLRARRERGIDVAIAARGRDA